MMANIHMHGNPAADPPAETGRDWLLVWCAFAGAYSWFNVLLHNGIQNPLSPLAPFVKALGASPEACLAWVYIPLALAAAACLLLIKDEALSRNRPFWLVVHAGLFLCAALLPVIRSVYVFYALCAAVGALCGLFIYRVFFSLFLYAPSIGWVKMFVLPLGAGRLCVYLFSLLPPDRHPYAMYAVSMAIMAATLVCSLKFRGNVPDARPNMPEGQPATRPLIPYLLFIGGVQIFIAALKAFVKPDIALGTAGLWPDILSSVAALSLIWFFGDRVKRKETFLRWFFVLMMLAFASHQRFGAGGAKLTRLFMEPALVCWDVFLFSMLACLFYNHGKRHVLLILFLMLPGQAALTHLLRGYSAAAAPWYGFIHVGAFALFMLIPVVSKTANLKEIETGKLPPSVSLHDSLPEPEDGPAPDDAQSVRALETLLPAGEKLTDRERDILSHLTAGQDTDVIAHALQITQNTVRGHIKNICGKYGVSSRAELLKLASIPPEKNPTAPIALTRREREVLRLLITGADNEHIARSLSVSGATIRTHIHNMCLKCGIKTREELIAFMSGKMPK